MRVFTLSYISTALTEYLDFVGRLQTMDDEQVAETAELILEEYGNLKFDDIALFFRNCKLSRYGKLYDLNGAALLNWFNTYRQERNSAEWRLYVQQNKERMAEEERRRRAEWDALTPEQQAEQQQRINNIINKLVQKFSC